MYKNYLFENRKYVSECLSYILYYRNNRGVFKIYILNLNNKNSLHNLNKQYYKKYINTYYKVINNIENVLNNILLAAMNSTLSQNNIQNGILF